MISLVLRKKVPLTEDALTAAVFDYFRREGDSSQLHDVLRLASSPEGETPLMAFDAYELELWPTGHRAGEPDALLLLKAGQNTVFRVVVEAKLRAPKSGIGDVTDDRSSGDQLARYLLAEAEDNPQTTVYLLYITHHLACPTKDLLESSHFLKRAGRPDLAQCLLWLPWHGIARFLASRKPSTAIMDLRTMLSRAVLHRFERFDLLPLLPTGSPTFYTERYHPALPTKAYPGSGDHLQLSCAAFSWHYRPCSTRPYLWVAPAKLSSRAEFFRREAL